MSSVPRLVTLVCRLLFAGGVLLLAFGAYLAYRDFHPGEVMIRAEDFRNVELEPDVAETRWFAIVNQTGRRIWLHNSQGWG